MGGAWIAGGSNGALEVGERCHAGVVWLTYF